MAEKTLEMTMLFDFYGDMLTEKQREYFDLYYNDDLSLSEIAETAGITRQGVHDMLARAESAMLDMERKIGAIARFNDLGACIAKAEKLAENIAEKSSDTEAAKSAREIMALLAQMKG